MVPAKERGRGWSFAQGKGFGLGQVGTGRSDDSGFVLVLRGCPGVVLQSRNQRRPSVQHVAISLLLLNPSILKQSRIICLGALPQDSDGQDGLRTDGSWGLGMAN